MKKAIQISYNDLFEKKCSFVAEAGFRYISVDFAELLDESEYEWKRVTEDIQRILERSGLPYSC